MTQEQLSKLDSCYLNYSLKDNCIEEFMPARQLLGSGRFDLYAILLYIDSKVRNLSNNSYHDYVYYQRTDAITDHVYGETGKPYKNNYEAYRSDLDKMIEDHLNGNFDDFRTIIPIDKNGLLLDGAHRVACAAYFNKTVRTLRFLDKSSSPVNYTSLVSRLLPTKAAIAMALESTKWHDDLYMLFFWPKATSNEKVFDECIKLVRKEVDVFYEKTLKLQIMAIKNLMIQLYGHMDWIGSAENGFKGIMGKVDSVWESGGICHFVLIRADSLQYVLDLKSRIRDMFDCGLASIHSTDNIRETRIAANALFNPNSLHFLENGSPDKYVKSFGLYKSFRKIVLENNYLPEKYIIDSGISLAMYGARESNDLDYICAEQDVLECINKVDYPDIDYHGSAQLAYYNLTEDDLLYNPEFYYTFEEFKFVSLPILKEFKSNRYKITKDYKDKADGKLIDSFIGGAKKRQLMLWFTKLKWNSHRLYRKYKTQFVVFIKDILIKLGIFGTIKKFVNKQ